MLKGELRAPGRIQSVVVVVVVVGRVEDPMRVWESPQVQFKTAWGCGVGVGVVVVNWRMDFPVPISEVLSAY